MSEPCSAGNYLPTSSRPHHVSRLEEVDVGDGIAVVDIHHPLMLEEMLAKFIKFHQGRWQAQFLESTQHFLGQSLRNHKSLGVGWPFNAHN